MRKVLLYTAAAALLLAATPSWGAGPVKKNRKQLEKENEDLRRRIEQLESELEAFRVEEAELEAIEEELSGENENKLAAALEDYTSSTDTLLAQWYMHRQSRVPGREQYDMDSVHFTTDVPDYALAIDRGTLQIKEGYTLRKFAKKK